MECVICPHFDWKNALHLEVNGHETIETSFEDCRVAFPDLAVIHSVGHFSDPASRLEDDESRRVWQLIQTHQFNLAGNKVTFGRIQTGFDWFLMALLFFSGIQLLAVARRGDPGLIRLYSKIYLAMVGALTIITTVYIRFLPPLILFGLIWIVLFLATFSSTTDAPRGNPS